MTHYAIAAIQTGTIMWTGRSETACAERLEGPVVCGKGETRGEAITDAVSEAARVRAEQGVV